jgi:hypothetical protein
MAVTASYLESTGLTIAGLSTNTLSYVTIIGSTSNSPLNWGITWDQTTGTSGYANGVAPISPSEIYVDLYNPQANQNYSDVWNFSLKPNGLWSLTFLKSTDTGTNHPTGVYLVGYDYTNNLTYTKHAAFVC